MKSECPNYREVPIKESWDNLLLENQIIIENFLNYCGNTSNNKKTHSKIKGKIILFADVLEKPLSDLSLIDLTNFLTVLKRSYQSPETKQDVNKQIKRFLKWQYEDYPTRFKEFRDIKNFQLNNIKTDRLNSDDLLTQEEFETILKATSNLKTKTMLILLWETACRPEEIILLKKSQLNLNKGTVEVFSNKTRKSRTIPIKNALPSIKRYINESFNILSDDMFLFPNDKNNYKKLGESFLNYELSEIEKKLNFHKRLFPYLIRHTILNIWLAKLPVDVYEKVAGHSITVATKTYSHLNVDKIMSTFQEKIFEAEELTKDEKEEIIVLRNDVKTLTEKLNKLWELMEEDMMNKKDVQNPQEGIKPLLKGLEEMEVLN